MLRLLYKLLRSRSKATPINIILYSGENMQAANPVLSVIIVTWNNEAIIRECLEWLYKALQTISFETIIVDNHSSDATCKIIEENFPIVRLIRSQENLGFAKGNNLGFSFATGKYIILLNPDAFLNYGSPEILISYMERNLEAQVIGANLRKIDGSANKSYDYTSAGSHLASLFKFLKPFLRKAPLPETNDMNIDLYKVETITGAFMLIRSSLIKKIGLFDEQFFAYFEETDFCHRARQHGVDILYAHDFFVTHIGGVSFNQMSDQGRKIFYQSKWRFIKKHYGKYLQTLTIIHTRYKYYFYKLLSILIPNQKPKQSLKKYELQLQTSKEIL